MFGAIIGIAAKFIGGGAAAGGAGGILGGLLGGGGGGILSSLFKGGPAKEIFDMVSKFKNLIGGADQQPPVGGFGRGFGPQQATRGLDQLVGRIENLLNRLEGLRNQENDTNGSNGCCGNNGSGGNTIRDLLRSFLDSTNSQNQVSFQFSRSQYTRIQA